MHSFLLASFFLAQTCIAGYVLEDDYNPRNFFDKFSFYDKRDPTDGFVKLVNQRTAQSAGLIAQKSGSVYVGVDSENVAPHGRQAVRLESKKNYNSGLIIADIVHMPGGVCGTWPAFWTLGPDWPKNGEIDIIEGVNSQATNAMTLHTSPGCKIDNKGSFSGVVRTTNCDTRAAGQGNNVGCGIGTSDKKTYGQGFNDQGGGVYAMEWTKSGISVWHFHRGQVPSDITNGRPNPGNWQRPLAHFSGGCNFENAFKNHTMVIDTTFCGQWAGQQGVWASDPVCSKKAPTCKDYVTNNPEAFAEAYWEFNSIKVYQSQSGSSIPAPRPEVVEDVVQTALRIPIIEDVPTVAPQPPVNSVPSPIPVPEKPTPTINYDAIAASISALIPSSSINYNAIAASIQALQPASSITYSTLEATVLPVLETTTAPLVNDSAYGAAINEFFAVSTSTTIVSQLTSIDLASAVHQTNVTVLTSLFSKPAPVMTPYNPDASTTLLTMKTAVALVDVTVTVTADQVRPTEIAMEAAFEDVARQMLPGGFIDKRPRVNAVGEIGEVSRGIHKRHSHWWSHRRRS